jgi:hypothetical protein
MLRGTLGTLLQKAAPTVISCPPHGVVDTRMGDGGGGWAIKVRASRGGRAVEPAPAKKCAAGSPSDLLVLEMG